MLYFDWSSEEVRLGPCFKNFETKQETPVLMKSEMQHKQWFCESKDSRVQIFYRL